MSYRLNKYQLEKYSRQIILKDVGALGQKKIIKSKVLIVGMGGLGCPVAEFLARAGVGSIGIIDSDNVKANDDNDFIDVLAAIEEEMAAVRELYVGGYISKGVYISETDRILTLIHI